MTGKSGDREFEEIRNVEQLVVDRLMLLSEEELLAELAEDGIDADAEAMRILELATNVNARLRMVAAKAAVSARRSFSENCIERTVIPANDIAQARGLTLAARNGSSQSEADIASVAADLARLAEQEDEARNE